MSPLERCLFKKGIWHAACPGTVTTTFSLRPPMLLATLPTTRCPRKSLKPRRCTSWRTSKRVLLYYPPLHSRILFWWRRSQVEDYVSVWITGNWTLLPRRTVTRYCWWKSFSAGSVGERYTQNWTYAKDFTEYGWHQKQRTSPRSGPVMECIGIESCRSA